VSSPPPGPEQQPNPFQPPPVGSYQGYRAPLVGQRAAPAASGEAIAALVCGILGWTCFLFGFVGIYLGARARKAAREYPDQYGGEQLALVGMILGAVLGGVQFLILLLYFGFFLVAFGMTLIK
jgi:hypothetical protein